MPKACSLVPLSRDLARRATRKACKYLYNVSNGLRPDCVADGIISKIFSISKQTAGEPLTWLLISLILFLGCATHRALRRLSSNGWSGRHPYRPRRVFPFALAPALHKGADMEVAMPATNPKPSTEPESESGRGCLPALVRLVWIFGGIVLIYCALFIAQRKGGAIADLALLFLALGIILVRFIDIKYLKGETMDNQPATIKHWRRYALKILIAAGLLYALAKLIAQKNLL